MSGTAPTPAEWLSLAAAPTFAAMALATVASAGGPMDALCGSGAGGPMDGMAVMYLLMSAVHVAPWLKRLGDPPVTDDWSAMKESECSPRQTL